MSNRKVGGYAIENVDFLSLSTLAKPPASKKKEKPVIHEIFNACAKICLEDGDNYWYAKFKLASYGKFPDNFGCADNIITFKKGAVYKTEALSRDVRETLKICKNFFALHGAYFSPKDISISENQKVSNVETLTWATAKRNMKDVLVCNYVSRVEKDYNLSEENKNQLLETIKYGIMVSAFSKNNIVMVENSIYEIRGLLWDEELKIFYIREDLFTYTKDPLTTLTRVNLHEKISSKEKGAVKFSSLWKNNSQKLLQNSPDMK